MTNSRYAVSRPRAESLLAKLEQAKRSRLRIYIGAAPGVGKTYEMLQDAHILRQEGYDVIIGFVETYGRMETQAKIGNLEILSRKKMEYRNVLLEEMNLEGILDRHPRICLVDELAHSNVPGSKNRKRYEDVLDLLDAGIHVMTAVNIQHLETLNDIVARSAGIRVRETIPDSFLKRADEVVNVDVTVEELRTRLKQGKIYRPEKIEQALTNFFRKGNLSTLRELALRTVAEEVGSKAAQYREREGLEPAQIPEKVMVCISAAASGPKLLRTGARIAGRLGSVWYAVYVNPSGSGIISDNPDDLEHLEINIRLAQELGASVVKLRSRKVADALIEFAKKEGITHVIFGQSARSRWEIFFQGSIINRFLAAVKDAAVQVIPPGETEKK